MCRRWVLVRRLRPATDVASVRLGGLDLGLERALGVRWAWHCEPDPHASRVLEHHWPGVPNLGDLFAVDWTPSSVSTSSPPDSPAPTTASPGSAPASTASTARSGSRLPQPFARFVPPRRPRERRRDPNRPGPGTEMQENLLSESSSPTWPTSAIGGPTTASELPTWARLTDALRWFCVAALPSAADARRRRSRRRRTSTSTRCGSTWTRTTRITASGSRAGSGWRSGRSRGRSRRCSRRHGVGLDGSGGETSVGRGS
jgi:hypothetical protein